MIKIKLKTKEKNNKNELLMNLNPKKGLKTQLIYDHVSL